MQSEKERYQRKRILQLSLLLIVASYTLMAAKWLPIDVCRWLKVNLTLSDIEPSALVAFREAFFIPIGALAAVATRLTLGIRILGPFRSILLGIAFYQTGVIFGAGFLIVLSLVLAWARSELRSLGLNYYGRISVMLCLVALSVIATALIGNRIGLAQSIVVAYFPMIVLCLVGDALARNVVREGVLSSIQRGGATILLGAMLSPVYGSDAIFKFMSANPESILLIIGWIGIVSRFCDWRIFQAKDESSDEVAPPKDVEEQAEIRKPIADSATPSMLRKNCTMNSQKTLTPALHRRNRL